MNREQMIMDNLNLVHYVINNNLKNKRKYLYSNNNINSSTSNVYLASNQYTYNKGCYDREDLYQVGVEALIKAVDRYDSAKGTFATYACKCIKGSILRYINDNDYGSKCYKCWDNVVDRWLRVGGKRAASLSLQ